MTTAGSPIFEPGDVVYGADPFKGEAAARPWVVVSNHEDQPFHGEQYIALSLTTRSWLDRLIEIEADDWVEGGTPQESRIVPWAIQSIASDDIDIWQGRLTAAVVDRAIESIIQYLQS